MAGPPTYGLDKNLTATVIVAKNGKVTHNLPYVGNAFYTQPHILGAIAKAMEVDHDTLRKYIAGTPGDAASQAYSRNKPKNSGQAKATPGQRFRNKLAPLVLAKRITRAEAAELLKVSGDEKALRNKVDEMVKAKQLTREEAKELLRDDQVDSRPSRGQRDR